MSRRSHPNIRYSGLWRPSPNDKMDCKTLDKLLEWFKADLKSAEGYYNRSLKPLVDAKWAPTVGSFREMVARAKKDIEISKANIETTEKMLVNNKCR